MAKKKKSNPAASTFVGSSRSLSFSHAWRTHRSVMTLIAASFSAVIDAIFVVVVCCCLLLLLLFEILYLKIQQTWGGE